MLADLALAVRTLRRRPGFAAVAIATLALGIGASTAIFSVAYGVSLRPLPYLDPDRLIRIYEANPASGKLKENVSIAAFHAWRGGAPSIESAALYTDRGTRFLADADRQPVTTMSVSPAFFEVLGARPMLGEGFKREPEYTRHTADDECMLSYAAWQRLFGGRMDVVGQTLEFSGAGDNDIYRVVGVMPESFTFDQPVDLWRPTRLVELPIARVLRNWRYDRVIARLRPGATIDRAAAELKIAAARLAGEFPAQHGGWTVTVESLRDSTIGTFGRATWLLVAAVAVVLLVTCLNVGSLLVARAVARERETAVRVALGAASWRLARLWLAEAAVLALSGGGLGVLLAWTGVAALKAAGPPGIPRLDAIAIDLPTLAVAALATLVSVMFFTLAPGRSLGGHLADGLRAGSSMSGDSTGRQVARSALTLTQCAGAALLVVLAVMLTRSFIKLMSVDLGWRPDGVVTMSVSPPMPRDLRRPWFRYVEWSDRLIARLESTPGIERAAITTRVPLSTSVPSTFGRGRGKAGGGDGRWPGVQHLVTDGYFDTMRIRTIGGRRFDATDRFGEAQLTQTARVEKGVAIVTESTARTLWPDRPAIGQAVWLADGVDNVTWREVIGVVADIQYHDVGESPALHVFVPWTQQTSGNPRLVVKAASGDATSIIPVVREIVRAVEAGTYIDRVATLDSLVSNATAQPRFTMRLVAAFAALALLLAAVGIYGTLSYVVGSCTREIGIRLALGAPRASILTTVARRGVLPAVAGGGIGLGVAVALTRTFRALLFGVEPVDPASFGAAAAALLLVALVAALGPALRASRVDPASALRAE